VETVTVTLELPVSAPLKSYVRALEAARDEYTDPKAKQALAAVTALASRGLVKTIAQSMKSAPQS
jgi:vancomycin resistance protein YoaR